MERELKEIEEGKPLKEVLDKSLKALENDD